MIYGVLAGLLISRSSSHGVVVQAADAGHGAVDAVTFHAALGRTPGRCLRFPRLIRNLFAGIPRVAGD